MTILIWASLVIATIVFVGYPLRDSARERVRQEDEPVSMQSHASIRSMIEDVEMDLQIGNTSQEEYNELINDYEDRLGASPRGKGHIRAEDDDIEKEIRDRKRHA